MDCEEVRRTALERLTTGTSTEQSAAMNGHVAGCDACRRFVLMQQSLDERLMAAMPQAELSPRFRVALRQKLRRERGWKWPEFLPDVAHVAGCAAAIAALAIALPQYSGTVMAAGAGFTALTYFLQAVLRSSFEAE